jgi:hypothetical protein
MVPLEFFTNVILPTALWLGVNSISKINEYQEKFLGWGLGEGGVKAAAA